MITGTNALCDYCGECADELEQRDDLPGVRTAEGGYRAAWVCAACAGPADESETESA